MNREDAARALVGLMVLLLPWAGVLAVLPLAAVAYLERSTRMLSASLALLLLMKFSIELSHLNLPMYVVSISFVVSTFACLASRPFGALSGSLIYLMTTVALGYPAAAINSSGLLPEKILFMTLLGGLSGAFLQHVSKERDFLVPFGACMVMWLFSFDYPLPELGRMIMIYIFALVLGLGAYWARAGDVDAILSEIIICILVVLFAGFSWFLLLLCFYLLGGAFTRYGYAKKEKLGIAQSGGGVRGYKNVYSNSLVPLALAILYGLYSSDLILFAYLGSVATACGDTLASEIGETSSTPPRMITTLRRVEPGVDGGVTALGEAASVLGAAAVGVLAVAIGMSGLQGLAAAVLGGFLGTNFDSLLGATLQRTGMLTNNGVNLMATLFGALAGGAIYLVVWS